MQQIAANDKSTVAVPGQARSGGGNDGADTRQGGSDGRSAAREFRRGDQISVAAKVSIIAEQAAPAPAAPALSANGCGDRQRRRSRTGLARGGAFVVRPARAERKITRNRCAN